MLVNCSHREGATVFIIEGHLKLIILCDNTFHFQVKGELLVIDFINAAEGSKLGVEAF